MKLTYVRLLAQERELYRLPRGPKRFEAYLDRGERQLLRCYFFRIARFHQMGLGKACPSRIVKQNTILLCRPNRMKTRLP